MQNNQELSENFILSHRKDLFVTNDLAQNSGQLPSESFVLPNPNNPGLSPTSNNDLVNDAFLASIERKEGERRKKNCFILSVSTGIASGIVFLGLGGAFSQDDKDVSNVLFGVGGGILTMTALAIIAYKKYYGNNINSHEGAISIFNVQPQPHILEALPQILNIQSAQEEVVREIVPSSLSQNIDQPADIRGAQEILREPTPPRIQNEQIQEEGAFQSKFDSTASPQKMEPVAMRPSISMLPRLTRNISSSHDYKNPSI
jgi:hypothetical protein